MSPIPHATSLRQRYHDMMAKALIAGPDGNSAFNWILNAVLQVCKKSQKGQRVGLCRLTSNKQKADPATSRQQSTTGKLERQAPGAVQPTRRQATFRRPHEV